MIISKNKLLDQFCERQMNFLGGDCGVCVLNNLQRDQAPFSKLLGVHRIAEHPELEGTHKGDHAPGATQDHHPQFIPCI